MLNIDRRKKIKEFVEFWKGKGYEKGESQKFWIQLLREVLGVENPEQFISFEDQVHLDHTSFIDGYIELTKVMIEQKSLGKNLNQAIKQSDGSLLNPFQQAKRYITELPLSKHPRYVVTCNFEEFYVYDMEQPHGEPEIIKLKDLEKEYYRLSFLIEKENIHLKKEMEISIKAGDIVGLLYDAFLKQYINRENEETLKSLNKLCVRLVFCLYAEDAGIFGKHDMFLDYLKQFDTKHMRKALIDLFKVLDTKIEDRDPYLEPELASFPYVNGRLFADEDIEIPMFTDEIRELLLTKASAEFDWSGISPTIFGAVFESTLNPETRRKGGMHYTSIENIHKVIDPLFLNDLNKEFKQILEVKQEKIKKEKLKEFQNKIANLNFLDPACGSGNFLTETYISLRKLENNILFELNKGQITMGAVINPIKVSIGQFYGIEINDFAVTVAKTALWIAESQMMKKTEDIVHMDLDFLPLKTYTNIVEANALRIDWNEVISKDKLNYIMGNPPFLGYSLQSKEQKDDILSIYIDEKGKPYKTAGKIDYVSSWYFKAAEMMYEAFNGIDTKLSPLAEKDLGEGFNKKPSPLAGEGLGEGLNQKAAYIYPSPKSKISILPQGAGKLSRIIKTALVSTNSITQGEQVAGVFKPLYERFNIHIDFAHKTFRWDSESNSKAHVHCVIVGFSYSFPRPLGERGKGEGFKKKELYSNDRMQLVDNINAYLIEAPDIFIESRNKPLCDVPQIYSGGKPVEGGFLIFTKEEKEDFISQEPKSEKFFRPFIGAEDYINNKPRYCLWLLNVNPSELRQMKHVIERIEKVKEFRLQSTKEATRECANTPHLFMEIKQPQNRYILVPATSSENRKYIPLGFVEPNYVANNAASYIDNATLYHFGILTSNVHMAWTRAVCGRLEMRYRYSNTIVYNNFPWCNPTEEQKAKIERTAQGILDARVLYPDCSLADLYDDLTMPPELRKAHQENDKAVMEAYRFRVKDENGKFRWLTESETVAELMKMYQELTLK